MEYSLGDFFKTKYGDIGMFIRINGYDYAVISTEDDDVVSVDTDDIVEVRRPNPMTPVHKVSPEWYGKAKVIWKKNKVAFLGASYQANQDEVDATRKVLAIMGYDIEEWDEFASTQNNNLKVESADLHVMVPPADFKDTHIIGLGLYNQYMTRKNAGKNSALAHKGYIVGIKKVFKLQDGDCQNAALVILP